MKSLCYFIFGGMVFLATACVPDEQHHSSAFCPVPFTLSENSAFFSEKNIELSIDSINNALLISLNCHFPFNAPFPVNAAFMDTLTETGFLMEVEADGKPLFSEYKGAQPHRRPYKDMSGMSARNALLSFRTDTIDLRTGSASIEIPYYAFHRLRCGMHEIELSISQDVLRSNHTSEAAFYDSVFHHPSTHSILNHVEKRMASAKARFRIYVPALHKTVLYMNRIDLKNDSTYSPYGSDNTIWNSSLPDIYWTASYPGHDAYAISDYETSTMSYTTPDTLVLYHYSITDTIGFSVYDHDNLSRDDGLGYGYFSLGDMIKRKRLNTSFWYVKLFSLKVDYKGVVNR